LSLDDGRAAIALEMPKRVPRTEYSAESHYRLIEAVTGIRVDSSSPAEEIERARRAFVLAWNYDFFWSTLIDRAEFGAAATSMGHAVYLEGGMDFDDRIHCPYQTPEEVLAFDPWETLGTRDRKTLKRRFEEHYHANGTRNPTGVNMTGIYVTCISGLIDLFGWEMLLLAAGTDVEGLGGLVRRYASWVQQFFDALAEANVPVVMVHDDIVWSSGAIFHPTWYRTYVFPNYRKFFQPLIESGKRVMFCSDGNFTEFVDDIAATGVHGFVFEPLTDLELIVRKYGKTHVIIGNVDTRILLSGTKARIRAEVERCMSLGKPCPGYFLAVGNHIPPNTPVENALYYNHVYEELSRR
jgi:hypothetical protein